MAIRLLIKRKLNTSLVANFSFPFGVCSFCSKVSGLVDQEEPLKPTTMYHAYLSLLQSSEGHSNDFRIEVDDHESWQVSSGLTEAWKQMNASKERKSSVVEPIDDTESSSSVVEDEAEFDDIEDMRFRGTLFYKLDRDSREFEECNVDLYNNKSPKKRKEEAKEKIKKEKEKLKSSFNEEDLRKLSKAMKNRYPPEEIDNSCADKKLRTPTYNQLTGPYHEPFCLDIFISKSSVRACVIHRVTSKVVVVAHSISKDMKFDLKSTKDENACVAVGEILAQRALADDIHDIVYTPRKGDKVEGKLQIVLQSLIEHGINVKVKLKQRNAKKVILSSK